MFDDGVRKRVHLYDSSGIFIRCHYLTELFVYQGKVFFTIKFDSEREVEIASFHFENCKNNLITPMISFENFEVYVEIKTSWKNIYDNKSLVVEIVLPV